MICDFKIKLNYKGIMREFIIPSVDTDLYTSNYDVLNYIQKLVHDQIENPSDEVEPFVKEILSYMNEQDTPTIKANTAPVTAFLEDKGININTLKNYVKLTSQTNPYSNIIEQLIDPIDEVNAPSIEFVVRPDTVSDTLKGVHYINGPENKSKITLYVDSDVPTSFDALSDIELAKTLTHELIHNRIDKTIGQSKFLRGVFENPDIQMLNGIYTYFIDEIVKTKLYKDKKDLQEIVKAIQKNSYSTDESRRKQQLREFVAYGLTEPLMQEAMNKVKVDNTVIDTDNTLLGIFVNWIKNTFGIKIKKGFALEEFLNASVKLFDLRKYAEQGFDLLYNDVNNDVQAIKFLDDNETTGTSQEVSERRVKVLDIFESTNDTGFITEDTVETMSKSVYGNLERHKKNNSLNINYAEPISLDPDKKATNDLQLIGLKQGDLVRIKNTTWDKENKKTILATGSYADYTSYVPVLYTYYSEKNDQIMAVIAKKFGDKGIKHTSIPAEFIVSYRKYYGELTKAAQKISDSDVKRIVDKHSELKYVDSTIRTENLTNDSSEDSELAQVAPNANSALLKKFKKIKKLSGDQVEIPFYVANDDNAYGMIITKSSKGILESLKENDIIKIASADFETKKQITYYAPVIRVFANAIEVARLKPNENGDLTSIIPFSRVKEAIILKDNHPDVMQATIENYDKFVTDFEGKMHKNPYIKKIPFKAINAKGEHILRLTDDDLRRANFDITGLVDDYKDYGLWKKDLGDQIDTLDINNLKGKDLKYYAYYKRIEARKYQISKLKIGDWIQIEGEIAAGSKPFKYNKWVQVLSVTSEKVNYLTYKRKKDSSDNHMDEDNYFVGSANIRTSKSDVKNVSIRSIAYNNQAEVEIIDYYSTIKDVIEENFNLKQQIIAKGKRGENTSQDWKDFFSRDDNWQNSSERYYTDMFLDIDDESKDLAISEYKKKLKAINRLQRGDVVYIKPPKGAKYKFTTKIVVDIDDDGMPVVGSKRKAGERTTKNGSTYSVADQYMVYKPTFSNIIGVGLNILPESALQIDGNEYISNMLESRKKRFRETNEYYTVSTLEEAESFLRKTNRANTIVVRQKVSRNGKEIFVVNVKDSDVILEGNDYGFSLKGKSAKGDYNIPLKKDSGYYNISNKEIQNINPKSLFEALSIGSIIIRTYKGNNNETKYTKGMVVKKNKNMVRIETYYENKAGIEQSFSNDIYIKTVDGKEVLNGVFSVDLVYDKFNGRGTDYFKKLITKTRQSKQTQSFIKSTDSLEHIKLISDRLEKLYNIEFKLLNSNEIGELFDTIDMKFSDNRAFTFDNTIVINTDIASIAEPLHEIAHFVLLGLKNTNFELYKEVLNSVKNHPRYDSIANYYPDLIDYDLDEEVFATVFGENYRGLLKNETQKQWEAENKSLFNRVIDNIKNFFKNLFGINNVDFDDLEPEELMNMSIEDIMTRFGNDMLQGHLKKYTKDYERPQSDSFNKLKSELINSNLIEENCYV